VLKQHSEELNLIFQIYAEADMSTVEASQRANTMNIKEFQLLLTHCNMLDELLTEDAVTEIFGGIQQSATDLASSPMSNEKPPDDKEEKVQRNITSQAIFGIC